ncbi:MAG: sulfatase-like hydrolase/transferase [Verrucomicrobiota bacterium]
MRAFLLPAFLLHVSLTAAEPAPNILFLLADDMRPDAIAAHGRENLRTPNLDALAREGMSFTRATCSYPICVVSRAEILTGRHGWENGVDGHSSRQFRSDLTFWPEAFRDHGYETVHIGKWHVSSRPSDRGYTRSAALFGGGGGRYWVEGQTDWKGFPITGYRGWVFQSEDGRTKFPEEGVGVTPDIDSKFASAAVKTIEELAGSPWMIHVNFTAPHDPLMLRSQAGQVYSEEDIQLPANYLPVHPFDHGNFDGRDEALLAWPRTRPAVLDLLRVYHSVIHEMDRCIGEIFESLEKTGQRENTIIIFTSDHGMGCGSHGLRGKQNQYEHTNLVPLIISGPDIPAQTSTDAMVYLRDLFPTTCELVGLPVPDSVTAESFAPVLEGKKETHHSEVFGYFTDTQRMIRTEDNWKLIEYPHVGRQQLFDLNSDANELNDLSSSSESDVMDRSAELSHRLEEWRKKMKDPLLN